MSFVQEKEVDFHCAIQAVLSLKGIVVKCTAAIFFPTVNWIPVIGHPRDRVPIT